MEKIPGINIVTDGKRNYLLSSGKVVVVGNFKGPQFEGRLYVASIVAVEGDGILVEFRRSGKRMWVGAWHIIQFA